MSVIAFLPEFISEFNAIFAMIFVIVMAAIEALLIWRFIINLKNRTIFDKQRVRISILKLLIRHVACPDCGARLAVCEKGGDAGIRLSTPHILADSEYYCPNCIKRFDISKKYEKLNFTDREIPAQPGTHYTVTDAMIHRYKATFLVFAAISAAAVIGVMLLISTGTWRNFLYVFIFSSGKGCVCIRPKAAHAYY